MGNETSKSETPRDAVEFVHLPPMVLIIEKLVHSGLCDEFSENGEPLIPCCTVSIDGKQAGIASAFPSYPLHIKPDGSDSQISFQLYSQHRQELALIQNDPRLTNNSDPQAGALALVTKTEDSSDPGKEDQSASEEDITTLVALPADEDKQLVLANQETSATAVLAEVSFPISRLVKYGAPLYTSLCLGMYRDGNIDSFNRLSDALNMSMDPKAPKVYITLYKPENTPLDAQARPKPDIKSALVEEQELTCGIPSGAGSQLESKQQIQGLIECIQIASTGIFELDDQVQQLQGMIEEERLSLEGELQRKLEGAAQSDSGKVAEELRKLQADREDLVRCIEEKEVRYQEASCRAMLLEQENGALKNEADVTSQRLLQLTDETQRLREAASRQQEHALQTRELDTQLKEANMQTRELHLETGEPHVEIREIEVPVQQESVTEVKEVMIEVERPQEDLQQQKDSLQRNLAQLESGLQEQWGNNDPYKDILSLLPDKLEEAQLQLLQDKEYIKKLEESDHEYRARILSLLDGKAAAVQAFQKALKELDTLKEETKDAVTNDGEMEYRPRISQLETERDQALNDLEDLRSKVNELETELHQHAQSLQDAQKERDYLQEQLAGSTNSIKDRCEKQLADAKKEFTLQIELHRELAESKQETIAILEQEIRAMRLAEEKQRSLTDGQANSLKVLQAHCDAEEQRHQTYQEDLAAIKVQLQNSQLENRQLQEQLDILQQEAAADLKTTQEQHGTALQAIKAESEAELHQLEARLRGVLERFEKETGNARALCFDKDVPTMDCSSNAQDQNETQKELETVEPAGRKMQEAISKLEREAVKLQVVANHSNELTESNYRMKLQLQALREKTDLDSSAFTEEAAAHDLMIGVLTEEHRSQVKQLESGRTELSVFQTAMEKRARNWELEMRTEMACVKATCNAESSELMRHMESEQQNLHTKLAEARGELTVLLDVESQRVQLERELTRARGELMHRENIQKELTESSKELAVLRVNAQQRTDLQDKIALLETQLAKAEKKHQVALKDHASKLEASHFLQKSEEARSRSMQADLRNADVRIKDLMAEKEDHEMQLMKVRVELETLRSTSEEQLCALKVQLEKQTACLHNLRESHHADAIRASANEQALREQLSKAHAELQALQNKQAQLADLEKDLADTKRKLMQQSDLRLELSKSRTDLEAFHTEQMQRHDSKCKELLDKVAQLEQEVRSARSAEHRNQELLEGNVSLNTELRTMYASECTQAHALNDKIQSEQSQMKELQDSRNRLQTQHMQASAELQALRETLDGQSSTFKNQLEQQGADRATELIRLSRAEAEEQRLERDLQAMRVTGKELSEQKAALFAELQAFRIREEAQSKFCQDAMSTASAEVQDLQVENNRLHVELADARGALNVSRTTLGSKSHDLQVQLQAQSTALADLERAKKAAAVEAEKQCQELRRANEVLRGQVDATQKQERTQFEELRKHGDIQKHELTHAKQELNALREEGAVCRDLQLRLQQQSAVLEEQRAAETRKGLDSVLSRASQIFRRSAEENQTGKLEEDLQKTKSEFEQLKQEGDEQRKQCLLLEKAEAAALAEVRTCSSEEHATLARAQENCQELIDESTSLRRELQECKKQERLEYQELREANERQQQGLTRAGQVFARASWFRRNSPEPGSNRE